MSTDQFEAVEGRENIVKQNKIAEEINSGPARWCNISVRNFSNLMLIIHSSGLISDTKNCD